MIKLFSSTDKEFSSNGDKIIKPSKAKVHKADNSDFYLEIETGIEYADDLAEGAILVAPTPQGDQAFRIANPQKSLKKVTVKAYHVFYDSQNYLIKDSNVVKKNCNDALIHLNSATDTESPFTVSSDIARVDSYRCVRKSLNEAITDVLNRWGGHLIRDNFSITVANSIGQDSGITVRYAKNLKEITVAENWDNVVTKLLPTGTDGIMLNALDPSVDPYVYSAKRYDIPYTKTVAFSQSIDSEQFKSNKTGNINQKAYKEALIADLRKQAQEYVNANCFPQVSYTLKASIDRIVDIGDVVEVIDERLGIDLLTHIISYDYDCLVKKYTEISFGNFQKKLSDLVDNITTEVTNKVDVIVSNSNASLSADLQEAQNRINSILGDSYVIYDGSQILVVDRLPKDVARNVIRINNNGIGFSSTGINGQFTSAWTINGTFDMQAINVVNLTATLIKGGTLKLGSNLNESGEVKIFDEANNLIGELNKNGLKMYGQNGGYVVLNNSVGFAGYDRLGNKIYWVDQDEFHQKKSVVEEEISLCNKVRFIPIEIYNGSTLVNDGIGIVGGVG